MAASSPPWTSVSIPPRFPDPFWCYSLGLCKRGDKGRAHETPRGNTFIGGNKGRCDGKRRHRVRLLRVVFTPLSLCLSVLLPYPCCNPLGWTIMREKPCKYEPRRSIGRGESRQTESFTNCQLFVKGFVSEMYILLLISCSGTCPHFV